jgi:hypothetical protein
MFLGGSYSLKTSAVRVSGSLFEPVPPGNDRICADLKSAGHSAVQILYKLSPECSKTPQNTLLKPLSHNNIRKTGSIRNRQVTSLTLVVGSILSITCDQFTAKCCRSYFRLQMIHGFGSIASTGGANQFPGGSCIP